MQIGKVFFYNRVGGFGVIVPELGGRDAFVHSTALAAAGIDDLRAGQRISYIVRVDPRGQHCACDLALSDAPVAVSLA